MADDRPELTLIQGESEAEKDTNFAPKIREEWIPQIMLWHGESSLGYKSIAKLVRETYGVSITPQGVSKLIKRQKAMRKDITQAVIQENLGQYILGDLEQIKIIGLELFDLSKSFYKARDWPNYWKCVDKLKDYKAMVFDLSGAHETRENTGSAEMAREEITDLLTKMTYKRPQHDDDK